MNLRIGVIKGDGIGPEIVAEAMKVVDQTAKTYGHTCEYTQLLMGGASIDVHGVPLTDETVASAKSCDAVLMGSIGGDAKTSPWYQLEPSKRPEAGLLRIRKELNLFANLRPAVEGGDHRRRFRYDDHARADGRLVFWRAQDGGGRRRQDGIRLSYI